MNRQGLTITFNT